VAGGCEPSISKEILLVGDSVTSESSGAIVQSFNHVGDGAEPGRYAPNFGSVVWGQGLAYVPWVEEDRVDDYWYTHLNSLMAHTHPEVIVVELGYNDCDNLVGYGRRIDGFMNRIPDSVPVHWLTMADPKDRTTCDTVINTELELAAVRHGNLSLLPYATFMNKHPDWTRDGIHLTAEGQRQYAAWLHDQLDARYPDYD
jgi:hypothetical protein